MTGHGIAKINKTGVICQCGEVSADRAAHRNHKYLVGAAGSLAAPKAAKKATGPAPIMWRGYHKDELRDISALGLPEGSARFFADAAHDAGNWSGSPLIGGNIASGRSAAGWMKKLNAEGLTTSFQDDDDRSCYWLTFTKKGRKLALDVLGFDPDPYAGELD